VSDFVTSSDLVLRVAVIVCAVSAVLALLLLLLVLLLRLRLLWGQRRRARIIRRWRPILVRAALAETGIALQDVLATLPRLPRRHHADVLIEWNVLFDCVRGQAADNLARVGGALGLARIAQRRLRLRGTAEKILALVTLGHLRDQQVWDIALDMLTDDNPLISMMAARALINIDATRGVAAILPVIRDREDWSTPRVAALLREAGPQAVAAPLAELIRGSVPEQIPKLIAVLAEVPQAAASDLLRELLSRPLDDRITAICLRIIEDPQHLPRVRELVQHPRWHLRMGAAVVLGRLGLVEDAPVLTSLLADAEWWVRYRAAQALLKIPGLGSHWLRETLDTLEDSFARDIVAHVLAEAADA